MMTPLRIATVMLFACIAAKPGEAQIRRQPPQEKARAPVNVSLQVGSGKYVSSAPGTCQHAPVASLYNVRSEMWSIEQSSGDQSMSLTLWNPADASEPMFNFSLHAGASERVSVARGQPPIGAGKITYQPSGKGGTFTLNLKTATGTMVTGTISCSVFTPLVAEGGDQ